jgi:hypothetical protein
MVAWLLYCHITLRAPASRPDARCGIGAARLSACRMSRKAAVGASSNNEVEREKWLWHKTQSRAGRKTQGRDRIDAPPAERFSAAHGEVVRLSATIQDAHGGIGRPWKARDTLARMTHAGSITRGMQVAVELALMPRSSPEASAKVICSAWRRTHLQL